MTLSLRRTLRLPTVLAAFGAVTACARPVSRPAPVKPDPRAPSRQLEGSVRACGASAVAASEPDTLERRMLGAAGGRVVRHGCQLTFRAPTGGDEVTLTDVLQEGDAWLVNRYRGHLPVLDAHLVARSRYEGSSYLLVFPGGGLVSIAGPPLLSPDGRRFATWNLDLEAEYDPNVLEIWRRTPGAARLEFSVASEEWGPSDVRWSDSTTITFVQNFPSGRDGEYARRHARLGLHDGRWLIEIHTR